MSVAFLTVAFAARIGKSSTKSVLVALADRADDKTGLLYPSVADLVERTELDRKTVLSCLTELQQKKILTDTGKRTGRTNQVKIWRLDFSLLQEASQKRDSSIPHSESIPKTEQFQKRNSSIFPPKASRFSAESVPKMGHGTTKEPSFNHHQLVGEELDDLVEAAIWVFRRGGGHIKNELGFSHKIRARILASGVSHEDAQSLLDWRSHVKLLKKQAARQPHAHDENIDIDACKKGVELLPTSLRARAIMNSA